MTQESKEGGDSMPHVDEGSLHAYLDGELPSAERKTLEAHLAECASCRAMLAEERALLDRASALLGAARPAERPAPPFEQLRPRATRRSPWRVRTPVAWAASLALALGIGYYLHEPGSQPAASALEQRNLALYRQEDERGRTEPQAEENKPAPVITTRSRPSRNPAAAPAPRVATIPPAHHDSADAAARAGVEGARLDSGAGLSREMDKAAAGVVAMPPPAAQLQPRNAAAAPAARAMETESLMAVEEAARRPRAALPSTTSWPIISRGAAQSLLGTDPVGVPGFARKIRRSPAADGTVVVEQQVDSATTIQIFQRRVADAHLDSSQRVDQLRTYQARDAAPTDRLARYVGRLRVEIAGPLSLDSLNRLLDQVQPLP